MYKFDLAARSARLIYRSKHSVLPSDVNIGGMMAILLPCHLQREKYAEQCPENTNQISDSMTQETRMYKFELAARSARLICTDKTCRSYYKM